MVAGSPLRVVILNANYPHYEAERDVLAPFGAVEIEHVDTHGSPEQVVLAVRDADAVMVRETPIPAAAIAAMTRCKVIVRYGVGVDNIDLAAARERKIVVANVPDYGSEEVSDHAFALLMSVARRITQRDKAVRQGAWGVGAKEKIYSMRGRTLGIVGYGRIGRAFHRKAAALGFGRTLVYDPFVTQSEPGMEAVDLDTLCREADVISLHTPLNRENYHLISADRFALMKQETILINTARGGIVDEAALVAALASGKLFGAGIDVFEKEPLDLNHPLLGFANVVLTDHTGWYSEECVTDLQTKAAQEVARVWGGNRPRSWVNRWED
ncbi:MAG TPA: C-terminal binding protein [Symbiobacteriaceae bacterium]|nr:C-terminal binding protein [Symbiobacteriaceae bacterium]